MAPAEKYLMIMTTCPDLESAERIGGELVAKQLAACVQIVPGIKSIFRWQGKVDSAAEYLVLIKTAAAQYTAVENSINDLHSYELPEIIAVPVATGLHDYLNWIDENTKAL